MSETPPPLWQLVEKWMESEKFIKRVYAHPQDYSDTKQAAMEGR